MSLGARIRQLRQSRGLTQAQLGKTDLSKSLISLLERNKTGPSVDTLMLIAQRLGVSVDSLLGQATGHMPEMIAEGLLALSRDAIRYRQYSLAKQYIGMASSIAEMHSLEEAAREAKLQAAQVALEHREFEDAWKALEDVRETSQRQRDYWRVGRALMLQGWLKVRRREFPDAEHLMRESLSSLRRARAGRDPARVEALIGLGTTLGYLRNIPEAIRCYEAAALSAVCKTDLVLRGRALWGLGLCHRIGGHFDLARDYLEGARESLEKAEELPDLARVLKNLGELHHERGQPKEALRLLQQSLRVMERLGKPIDHASTMTEIGRVYLTIGQLQEARRYATEAQKEAEEVGDPVEVAEATVVLAGVLALKGDATTATLLVKQAAAEFEKRGMREKMFKAAKEIGMLLRHRGAHAEASELLAMATACYAPARPTSPLLQRAAYATPPAAPNPQ